MKHGRKANSYEVCRDLGCQTLLIPRREAFLSIGVGVTKGHDLINRGQLVARKMGTRTMIEAESLRRFVSSLPTLPVKPAA